eukprot:5473673-Prymnesium_polylepis.1
MPRIKAQDNARHGLGTCGPAHPFGLRRARFTARRPPRGALLQSFTPRRVCSPPAWGGRRIPTERDVLTHARALFCPEPPRFPRFFGEHLECVL